MLIYYIVNIQKNLKIYPSDISGTRYRTICTTFLSEYYIKNKMNIQLYEFSYICSRLLSIKIEQCAHIVYYLVYGRFASHPYINFICVDRNVIIEQKKDKREKDKREREREKEKEKEKEREKCRRQTTDTLSHTKMSKYKISAHQKKDINWELNTFSKELKKSLEINFKATKNKDFLNTIIKNSAITENDQHNNQNYVQTSNTVKNVYIAQRVKQKQTSLIFCEFNKNRSPTYCGQNWAKNGSLRKQRFDDFFNLQRYKIKSELNRNYQQSKQNNGKNNLRNNLRQKDLSVGQNKYHNFKQISKQIKINNGFLDRIRSDCNSRRINSKSGQIIKKNLTMNGFLLEKSVIMKQNIKIQQYDPNNNNFKNNQDKENSSRVTPTIEVASGNLSSLKQILNRQKNIPKHVQIDNFDINYNPYIDNLLREDIEDNQMENIYDKFQGYSRMKRPNTKLKIRRYRKEFTKFAKTQMFDRIKQAIS